MKTAKKSAKKAIAKPDIKASKSVLKAKLPKAIVPEKPAKSKKSLKPVKAKTAQIAKSPKKANAPKLAKVAKLPVKAIQTEMGENNDGKPKKMKRKVYEAELRKLHEELVALQLWVVKHKLKVMVVFEGRDGAGKGGLIKAMTERVSPRVFRVVALPAPTEREKTQIYMQRYIKHFPAAGEVVIFDRSWYNRAGVEKVLGFCTEQQTKHFLDGTPLFEKAMVDGGVILIKYWLEVSEDEQTKRLSDRIHDGRKIWKLSPMDLKSYGRFYDYSRARDEMFKATDNGFAPWFVGSTEDIRRGRLNFISHFLSQIPYEKLPRKKIKLPKRQKRHGYVEQEQNFKAIEEKY